MSGAEFHKGVPIITCICRHNYAVAHLTALKAGYLVMDNEAGEAIIADKKVAAAAQHKKIEAAALCKFPRIPVFSFP